MPDNDISCLHVGLPKTATTTLQNYLYPVHPDVFYLGKFYPPKAYFLDQEVQRIVTGVRDPESDEARLDELGEHYRRVVAGPRAAGRLPVWSDELEVRLSHDALRQRVKAFRRVFGPCKVLITIRQPVSFVKSLYLHLLTSYQIERERWLPESVRLGYRQRPMFASMDQWLDRRGFEPEDDSRYGVANFIDVATLAETFAESFGEERVGVFLFEQMVRDLPGFVDGVCGFLGIDPEPALPMIRDRRSAKRVSQETLDRLEQICASPWRTTLFRHAPQWMRNRMTRLHAASGEGQRAEVAVSEEWQRRIEDVARDSYGRLLERWPLPLQEYGYPVPDPLA